MRKLQFIYSIPLVILGVFNGIWCHAQSQLPECDAVVPFFNADLSANPDSTYTTPEFERKTGCCEDNDDYVSFYVTLHPQVAMFELVVAPGYADPGGSGNYNIISGGDLNTPGNCGTPIPGGNPICITGAGPHKIVYSKPGSNKIKYIFKQIPQPIFPSSQPTRYGCSLPLNIYGLNGISIQAISKSANLLASLADCNTFLSCVTCPNPTFEAGPNPTYPYTITYQVQGTPQASACGTYPTSGTFTITVYNELSVSATPNPASFCSGGPGVLLTATATGGYGAYGYIWLNSAGDTVSTTSTYTATIAGNYTVQAKDGLISSTCGPKYVNIPVSMSNPPTVNAGIDQTICATNPTALLTGTSSTTSGVWSNGTGTFAPNANSLITQYTASAAEINAGSVTLTLTSTGTGPGCTNTSDQVTIFFSDTVYANPAALPIACYNGTTSIHANVLGGTPPYQYTWSTGINGSSITASAGTYSVTATDQYGCKDQSNITITQPNPLALNLSSTLDNGTCNGTATVVVSGGTPPFTYAWSNGNTGTTSTNWCYGIATATVTDANGCTQTGSVVVNNPTCTGFNVSIPTYDHVSCFGGSDGSATATTVGGTGTITYTWNTAPSQNTSAATNLPSGTYTVTATDQNGCFDIASIVILQPTILTNAITHVDESAVSAGDGSATANPQGGTPGYTYLWSPTSQTTQTANNLSAGTGGTMYQVTITDANLCVKTDSVLINQPPCNSFMLGINTSNVTCPGQNTGSAQVIIANGTEPYNIAWSNGSTNTTSLSNLAAGNYAVTVTDASSCSSFITFTITQPNTLTTSLVPTNITCNGENDGTIDLTVSGGTAPYTYVWMSGGKIVATHEDLTNLGPGTYSVTITDANGCIVTASIGITQPQLLNATYTYVDNPCFGNSLGSINMTVTGGVQPYSYQWSSPSGYTANTQDISGLAFGLYELLITDLNGCQKGPVQVYINQPDSLIATATMTQQVACNGGSNGAAAASVIGGTPAYQYSWTGPSSYTGTGSAISNLSAGTYFLSVTDAHACNATASVNITTVNDVTPPNIICPANQTAYTSASACTYQHSGAAWNATATDNCSVASLIYALSGATSGTGSTLNNVVFNKGTTTVTWTVTDGSGNTASCSYTVSIIDNVSPQITSCGGTGIQQVNTNNGTCTYQRIGTGWDAIATDNCTQTSKSYTLTGATTGTGATLDGQVFNLGITTVTWTFTDNSGNFTTCSFQVKVVDNQLPTFTSCGNGNQTVETMTGVCTYTHTGSGWNPVAIDNCSVVSLIYSLSGATTGSGTSLNNVVFNKGITFVDWTATDGSGNTAFCTYVITVEDDELPSIVTCGTNSNQTVFVNTGLCTYTHPTNSWNATASDNCSTVNLSYTLTGATSGTGTSLNGKTFNLGLTTVTWTASDLSGNSVTCSFTVNVQDNQLPVITNCGPTTNQNVYANAGQCHFTQTGTSWNATATDNCTVNSITYSLSGATSGTGTSLQGVNFNVGQTTVTWTVTDGAGNTANCSFVVEVKDIQTPVISNCGATGNQIVTSNTGVCTYTKVGNGWNAVATDNCGVSSLTYTLSGATSGTGTTLNNVIFNLGSTLVTWTALDNALNSTSCSFTVIVTDNEVPVVVNCPTNQTISTDNGVCGAVVNWTDPTFTDNCSATMVSNHQSGEFFPVGSTQVTYLVTDGSGNQSTCSFQLSVIDDDAPIINCIPSISSCDPIITFPAPIVSDNCGILSTIQLTGLASGSVFPVGNTINTFQTTDVQGNTSTCSFTVTIHSIPQLTLQAEQISCNSLADASIDLSITDSDGPFEVLWSNQATTEDLSMVAPGTYSVEVSDSYGCTSVASIAIQEPATLEISTSNSHVTCHDGTDGAIDATVIGGTTPYFYTWSTGDNTEDIADLQAGTYVLIVSDANGCLISYGTTLNEPDSLIIQSDIQDATCDANNGSIQIQVTGGTTPYNYSWSNGTTNMNLNNSMAGTYSLAVTDKNGCTTTYTGTISSVSNLSASTLQQDVLCYGQANGEIQVIVRNGNAPYQYVWSNGAYGNSVDSLGAGNYAVLITDSFGCNTTLNITIAQPDSINLELTISQYISGTNISLNGGNDGSILSSLEGGIPPFNYQWSNGSTASNLYDLTAGTYSLTVTDQNGCPAYKSIVLTEPFKLEMPSGFSPNADNNNDFFVVRGIEAYPENELLIFNRWGNLVYQKSNYENEWKGDNTRGEELPESTYFAILKVFGKEEITLQGYVDLRR